MDDLKKLYALLAVLIVIYVGVNFSYNGLDTINSLSHVNLDVGLSLEENDENSIVVGNSSFAKVKDFKEKNISDKEISLHNPDKNITINVVQVVDYRTLEDIVSQVVSVNENITSNQTITQNGITAYFLYEENVETYNAIIYFNKNNENYLIKANNISYSDSDYFINTCKDIINSMKPNNNINFSRY